MHTNLGAPLHFERHYEGRRCVEVADMIAGIGMAALRVVERQPDGSAEVLWAEQIEIAMQTGYPVKHHRHDGRVVDYGGPAHPFYGMAQKRAADLLQARLDFARGVATAPAAEATSDDA